MKRILAAVLMCGAGSCIAADATTAKKAVPLSAAALKAQTAKKEKAAADLLASMAPADEYFGPLKLSIIGISNTIRDIGLRYKYNHDLASQCLASAQLSESAVRDWMHRYPHDPQLPRNVFFLQRLYSQILLQSSRDRAASIAKVLFDDFGSSPQARQLKKTLAVEHLTPLPSPTPLASPTPASDATVEPAVAPSPQAIPTTPVGAPTTPLGVPSAPAEMTGSPRPYAGPTAIPSGSISPIPSAPATVPSSMPTGTPVPAATIAPAPTAAPGTLPSPAPAGSPAPTPAASATASPVPDGTPGASPVPLATTSPR